MNLHKCSYCHTFRVLIVIFVDFQLTTRTGISNGEKSDGSFKLNVGRIQISALTKFVTQFNVSHCGYRLCNHTYNHVYIYSLV